VYTAFQVRRPVLHILGVFVCIIGVMMALPPPVYAYVDPGSGSYILQVIIAGIAAASLSLRLFWTRIKALFSRESVDEDTASRE